MGGGGGQGAQRREPLLARQHRLGDVQRQRHARRFHRGLPHIAGGERDAGDIGQGRAHSEAHRDRHRHAGRLRQRQGGEGQPGRDEDRQGAQDQHRPERQGGRGQGHRRDQHQDEGIRRAAGEEDQRADLQDVDTELDRGLAVAEHPLARGGDAGQQVEPGACAHHREAQGVGHRKAQHHDQQQQCHLARHDHPAQGDERAHPQAAAVHGALGPVVAVAGQAAALHGGGPGPIETGLCRLGGGRPQSGHGPSRIARPSRPDEPQSKRNAA